MTSTDYKPAAQKSVRLYALVGFLVLLLAFVAVTFYLLTRESRNEQEWIRLSTDMQVHSQQLAKSAAEAVEGDRSAFLQLGDSTGVTSDAVEALKDGDPVRSLPPLPDAMSETLTDLDRTWRRMSTNAHSILDREDQVLELAENSNEFIQVIPKIQDLTDQAIRELTQNAASNQHVFVAGRQLVLSDRILRHLKEMLRGGPGAVAAADNFTQEIAYFEQTMNALLQGSRSIGIPQVTHRRARQAERSTGSSIGYSRFRGESCPESRRRRRQRRLGGRVPSCKPDSRMLSSTDRSTATAQPMGRNRRRRWQRKSIYSGSRRPTWDILSPTRTICRRSGAPAFSC